jgi:hypothetical protein
MNVVAIAADVAMPASVPLPLLTMVALSKEETVHYRNTTFHFSVAFKRRESEMRQHSKEYW